ncbi:D-2-hydroxyacid dehydrogenase [Isoalcanivorax indicus]|uniref:D-2-hydroxyacid dehydrogenase n=1 Tax=Isoalcanivorax indicus TaxID=2202653 RepID=UPI001B8725D6|nr:D-2-hydroxyacid dehydrogenase [Isoalcanivorax indicus]
MSEVERPTIERVLFVQKSGVLEQQREQVKAAMATYLPQAALGFASCTEDLMACASFDVVIAPTLPELPDILARVSGVKWIHFLSAGVEKIWDMPFDKEGVLLTKSSGVHGAPMSEFAIGAMLFFAKQFNRFVAQSREHRWERTWLQELTGQRLVVLGLGHIGQALAQRARAFGMTVTGTLRHPRPMEGVVDVRPQSQAGELLAEADYVAVCLPLTDETRGFVNQGLLAQLKPGAVLVDISRGGVVRGDAVLNALDSGQLRGAALDVFEQQPLPAHSPLWNRQDLLLTPHVSGTTPYYLERALDIFARNAEAYQAGESLVTPVDVSAGY